MSNTHTQELLTQARGLTENEEFADAVLLCDQAYREFVDAVDYTGAIQALADKVNALRHRFNYTKQKKFARECMEVATLMMELFSRHQVNGQAHLVHYRMATAHEVMGDWAAAAAEVKLALNAFAGSNAQRGDWQVHLGYALFNAGGGRETAGKIMRRGEGLLNAAGQNTDPFALAVWQAGACIKLADFYRGENPKAALQCVQAAQHLVVKNPGLKIRAHELAEFIALYF